MAVVPNFPILIPSLSLASTSSCIKFGVDHILTTNSIVGRTGYYWPWALLSAVLAAIGGGLLSTVLAHTAIVRPIMYQFIAGLGRGCGMQTVSYFESSCCLDLGFLLESKIGLKWPKI